MQEEEIYLQDNKYEAMKDLVQLKSVDGETCNICNEGYDTETDVMKHLNIHHTEILQKIFEQSKEEDALKSVKDNNPKQKRLRKNTSVQYTL